LVWVLVDDKKFLLQFFFLFTLSDMKRLWILLVLFANCTYSFVSTGHSEKVYIPMMENKTVSPGLESAITQALTDALIQDGRLRVVDKNSAKYVLNGVIEKYERNPATYDTAGSIKEYKINISLSIKYKKCKDDKKVWEGEINENTIYSASLPEEDGIKKLANRIKDDILRNILEGW